MSRCFNVWIYWHGRPRTSWNARRRRRPSEGATAVRPAGHCATEPAVAVSGERRAILSPPASHVALECEPLLTVGTRADALELPSESDVFAQGRGTMSHVRSRLPCGPLPLIFPRSFPESLREFALLTTRRLCAGPDLSAM